jgi:hypothetical protein
MKRLTLCLLLSIAACGPALAQSNISARVSPALGLADFRDPMNCSGVHICAVVSPARGNTDFAPLAGAAPGSSADARRTAALLEASLLLGPTPRPDPNVALLPQA